MSEKGEAVAGHKYLERKPDGKGGWLYRYLAGHEIEITPHEKLGMRGTLKWKVFDSDDTHASVGFHATVPGYGHKISHDALAMYKDDLEGRVVSDKPSGDLDIDAVTSGKAEFLGKGDDGLVFRSGDNVVKVSTVVPYQPSNPWYKTAQKAVEVAREQHETQQALRDLGVPGLLPERFVEHDGRGYTIKRYVGIPDKLTLDQLDAAHDTVLAMHKAGYVLGDVPQVGVDEDGKAVMFDVGKASKAEPYDGYRHLSPQQSDLDGLEHLYSTNGQRYTPRGANLEYEWETQLRHVLKFPPKQDVQRDKFALDLIDMSHALRKDADAFGKLVIDQDLAEALKKLERPEQINVAKLLEDAPAAIHAELPHVAARAVKAGARAGTLELLGAGAEGIVFTDGADAYKAGRPGNSRKNEAAALEVLSKDPRTKDLVPSFGKYDADNDVIVRAAVEGRPGGWGSKGLWEAHQTIAKVLREHEFTAPEFKENSFVIEGDKPKMIDIGYVQPIGKRAAAALNTKISGLRAIDFQIDPYLASSLSLDLFATFDEGAMSIDQLSEHVAKVRELAPARQFSDLDFESRLKDRASADISPLHIDAVKSVLKEYAPEFHTIGLRIVDDDPPEVGSILAESRRWEDGEPTEDILDGTSAIDLGGRDGSDVSRALDHAKAYRGKYALLLGSQSSEEGEDTDRFGRPIERVMRKPEVLARFKLKKSEGSERPGHKYIRREPDGKGGHNYFYEDEKGARTPAAQNTYGVAPDLGMTPAHKKKIAALAASMKGISHTDDAFADHEDEASMRGHWLRSWLTKTTPGLALIGQVARGRADANTKQRFAAEVLNELPNRVTKKEIADCEAMAVRQYAATQALFAAKGERTVRIHRGIAHDQGKALVEQAKQAQGGTVPVAVRSLSSWTSDHESAHDFGTQYTTRGAVVTLDVPVEAVLFHAEHEADLGAYEGEEETLVMSRDVLHVPAGAISEAHGELGEPDPQAFQRHRISLPHRTEKQEAEHEAQRAADKKSAKAAEKQKQAEWEAGAPAREAAAQAAREAAQAKRAEQDKVAAERQQKLEVEQYHASKLPKAEREKLAKELLAKPGVIRAIGQLEHDWRAWLGVDMKGNATREDDAAPDIHPDTYAAVKARAEGVTKAWASTGWIAEDLLKGAKGEERPGHKYTSRKPDGKGGWLYEYADITPSASFAAWHLQTAVRHALATHGNVEASKKMLAEDPTKERKRHLAAFKKDAGYVLSKKEIKEAKKRIARAVTDEDAHAIAKDYKDHLPTGLDAVFRGERPGGEYRAERYDQLHAELHGKGAVDTATRDPATTDPDVIAKAHGLGKVRINEELPEELRTHLAGLVSNAFDDLAAALGSTKLAHGSLAIAVTGTESIYTHGYDYGARYKHPKRGYGTDARNWDQEWYLSGLHGKAQDMPPTIEIDTHNIDALAHEFGHAVDEAWLHFRPRDLPMEVVRDIAQKHAAVLTAASESEMGKRAKASEKPDYWANYPELFARTFEQYVATKLRKQGRANSLLTRHTYDEKVHGGMFADQATFERDIEPLMDVFMDAVKQAGVLHKAFRAAIGEMDRPSMNIISMSEAIRKARTKGWASPEHKYLSRKPDGKGGFSYVYQTELPAPHSQKEREDRTPAEDAQHLAGLGVPAHEIHEHISHSHEIDSHTADRAVIEGYEAAQQHAESRGKRLEDDATMGSVYQRANAGSAAAAAARVAAKRAARAVNKSAPSLVLRKAREEGERPGHKYTRRTPDGKGGWQYDYGTPGQPGDKPPRKPAGEVRLTRPQLDDVLEHGTYSIISAGRNGNDSREKDMHPEHAEFKARHEKLRGELSKRNMRYTEVEGHYGSKEPSFIVHHDSAKPQASAAFMVHHDSPSEFGVMRTLGKQFNQDSVIHSHRGAHELHFTTGEHEGEHHKGKGHEYKPGAEDFYTKVETPGRASKFALSFDWDKHHAFKDAILKALLVLEKSRKLHRRRDFRGLKVSVENQAGSYRHWYDSHAKRAGKTKMIYDYGYVRRTQGTDGDHVDVYVGPDKMAPYVFVIDQLKSPDFVHTDEQKCMLGFPNLGAAVQAYRAHYDDPRFLGQVRAVAFEDFAAFITDPKNHGTLIKSYVTQRYSPSQEPPDFEGIYGTVQTEKEVKASRRRRKAIARRNSGKYAFHGVAQQKPAIRFRVREWATIRDAQEAGKRGEQ